MPGQGQGGPNEYVKRIGCIFLRSRSYNFVGSKIFLFCQSCNLLRPFSQNNVRKHQRSHFLSKSSRRIFCLKIKEKGEIKEPRDARLLLRRGIGPVPNQLEASCLSFTCFSCCQQFSLSLLTLGFPLLLFLVVVSNFHFLYFHFSRLLKLLWQYKVLFLPVVLKHPINLLFLSFLFGPNLAQICQHWLVLLTNQERNGKQKSRRRQLFLRGKTGQRLWERGGMFNKSWKENFHKIYLAVAQKPLLLIQVCESSIELRNIKSLNVRTLMFQHGGAQRQEAQRLKGGILRSFHPRL